MIADLMYVLNVGTAPAGTCQQQIAAIGEKPEWDGFSTSMLYLLLELMFFEMPKAEVR